MQETVAILPRERLLLVRSAETSVRMICMVTSGASSEQNVSHGSVHLKLRNSLGHDKLEKLDFLSKPPIRHSAVTLAVWNTFRSMKRLRVTVKLSLSAITIINLTGFTSTVKESLIRQMMIERLRKLDLIHYAVSIKMSSKSDFQSFLKKQKSFLSKIGSSYPSFCPVFLPVSFLFLSQTRFLSLHIFESIACVSLNQKEKATRKFEGISTINCDVYFSNWRIFICYV